MIVRTIFLVSSGLVWCWSGDGASVVRVARLSRACRRGVVAAVVGDDRDGCCEGCTPPSFAVAVVVVAVAVSVTELS